MFYLCFGGVQRIDHKLELSPRAHYIVKPSKNEVMRILEEENVFMNYRWLSRSLVILALEFTCKLNNNNQGKVEEEDETKENTNIKRTFTFINCRDNGRKEEGTSSVSLSTSASLSYLHESSSTLSYIQIT